MKISTSKIKTYKGCRRLYYFQYIENLECVVKPQAIEEGLNYHDRIDQLYKNGYFDCDGTDKNIAMAFAYEKYIYPQFKVKKSEEWFECNLSDDVVLVGRFDGIAEDGCIVEHKTTSSEINDEYIYNLQWDEQILNYMLVSGKNEMYYTVCRKPTIRQKQNETEEEYFSRCVDWYKEDTEKKIRVIKVTRSPKEVLEQQQKLIYVAKEMEENEKKDKELAFYRNPSHCTCYGRRCQYASICLDYKPELEYVEFKKKEM